MQKLRVEGSEVGNRLHGKRDSLAHKKPYKGELNGRYKKPAKDQDPRSIQEAIDEFLVNAS